MRRRDHRGFTLVELMIAVVIAAILLALGLPAFTTWIANIAIRTNAEAITSGIQLARTEAVRRNTAVRVVLTAAGTSWTVAQDSDGTVIQEYGGEGRADTVTVSFCPTGGRTLTFNALGGVNEATPISQIAVNSSTISATQARRMCVVVFPGGGARMCDPQRLTTDPQGCPTVPEICRQPAAACP